MDTRELNNKQTQIFINKIATHTANWDLNTWKKFRKIYGYKYNPRRPDLRLLQIIKFNSENQKDENI
jgi:hypothetical protein